MFLPDVLVQWDGVRGFRPFAERECQGRGLVVPPSEERVFHPVEIPADVRLLLDELAVCTDKDSPYLFPFLSGKKTGEAAYAEYNGALLRFNRNLRSLAETCGVGEPVTLVHDPSLFRHDLEGTGRTDRDDQ